MTRTFTFVAPLMVAGAAFAGDVTIQDLAPRNSMMVVGVSNVERLIERFEATPLWDMIQSEEMADFRAEIEAGWDAAQEQAAAELGLGPDEGPPMPSGAAGMAVFPVPAEDGFGVKPGILVFADYGDGAEAAAKLMESSFEQGAEAGELEYEHKNLLDRTVWAIDVPQMPDGLGVDTPVGDPMDMVGQIDTVYYLREGSNLIVASEMPIIIDAIEQIGGEQQPNLASKASFDDLYGQMGDPDLYAVSFVDNVFEMAMAGGGMGAAMLQPMIEQFVGEIESGGYALRFDGEHAMLETTAVLHMPRGTGGLTALMDKQSPIGDAPAFVRDDVQSVTVINFEFDGVVALIRPFVQMAMAMGGGGDEVGQMLDMVSAMLGSIGPSVCFVSGGDEASSHNTFAIETSNPDQFVGMLNEMGAGMGLEAGEVDGHSIFRVDPDALAQMAPQQVPVDAIGEPMAIGVTDGFVMLGTNSMVERALSAPDANGGFKARPEFTRAMELLGNDPAVAWGWMMPIDAIEMTVKQQAAALNDPALQDMIRDQIPDQGVSPDEAMEIAQETLEAIDFELMRRYLGPASWSVRAGEKGFVGRGFWLGAEK